MYNYILKRIGWVISLVLCCIHSTQGQTGLKHLTVANGLHSNQVRQIIELPNGQMLAVTEGMFNLYDGRAFRPCVCNLDSVYNLPSFGGHSFFGKETRYSG